MRTCLFIYMSLYISLLISTYPLSIYLSFFLCRDLLISILLLTSHLSVSIIYLALLASLSLSVSKLPVSIYLSILPVSICLSIFIYSSFISLALSLYLSLSCSCVSVYLSCCCLVSRDVCLSIHPFSLSVFLQVSGTVKDIIARKDETNRGEELMKDLELDHLADREICNLSGGELQRFCICVTAIQKNNVYMFDEPSSYLDVKQRLKAAQVIRSCLQFDNFIIVVSPLLSSTLLLSLSFSSFPHPPPASFFFFFSFLRR